MLGLGMLDVAIGIIFVFLLLSLICSALNELIESWLKLRATNLEQGIRNLVDDLSKSKDNGTAKADATNVTEQLYNHPLIYSLFKGSYSSGTNGATNPEIKTMSSAKTNLPSYIPAKNFAIALIDTVVAPGPGSASPLANFQASIENANINDELKKALLAIARTAKNDMDKVREGVENWYNSAMDRVSGWYKRRVQRIVFIMGFAIAILINVDTISIFTNLSNDRPLRDAIVTAAKDYKGDAKDSALVNARIKANVDSLLSLGLPIGWGWKSAINPSGVSNPKAIPCTLGGWLLKILGWLITGLAVSLGAPFWFDVLGKIMVVRSTVKPHEKSPEEASQDRTGS